MQNKSKTVILSRSTLVLLIIFLFINCGDQYHGNVVKISIEDEVKGWETEKNAALERDKKRQAELQKKNDRDDFSNLFNQESTKYIAPPYHIGVVKVYKEKNYVVLKIINFKTCRLSGKEEKIDLKQREYNLKVLSKNLKEHKDKILKKR